MNPKMFNAFLALIQTGDRIGCDRQCNRPAGAFRRASHSLRVSVDVIPTLMRPRSEGGILEAKGQVEVVSCLTTDGVPDFPNHIRKGVWVCFEGDSEYIRNCSQEYNVVTDPSPVCYMSSYKKWHLIGLELGISVAAIALRGEPTGVATCSPMPTSPRPPKGICRSGDTLDGEGGYTVFGKLDARPHVAGTGTSAVRSRSRCAIPSGRSAKDFLHHLGRCGHRRDVCQPFAFARSRRRSIRRAAVAKRA